MLQYGNHITLVLGSLTRVAHLKIKETPSWTDIGVPVCQKNPSHIFLCPERLCSETFSSQVELHEHIEVGWHKKTAVPRTAGTVFDTIWKYRTSRVTGISNRV